MLNLDPAVKKTTKDIAIANLCLTAVENAVFIILGKWSIKVLYSSLLGCAVATLCFLLIGISVQNAVSKNPNSARVRMQKSFLGRVLLMGVFVYLMIAVPAFSWAAAVIPLFFTRISISITNLKKGESKE